MKLHSGLLLVCLALTGLVRAEEAAPLTRDSSAPKQELVWPEIKDPQALIDFAKAEIAKLKESGKQRTDLMETKLPGLALELWRCDVYSDYVFAGIIIPERNTMQALLIVPDPKDFRERHKDFRHHIDDTNIPEIKRCVMYLPVDMRGEIEDLEKISVRWKNLTNLDKNKSTWPIPLFMVFPTYPNELLKQGIIGEARVEITVSLQGEVEDIHISATLPEFESAVRAVAKLWRFEPGIDRQTQLYAKSHLSFVILFNLND